MPAANPWAIFAVASAAVFFVSVDAKIAVAVFPALRLSFADAAPSDLSWVLKRGALSTCMAAAGCS